ncbi:hypothetical protein MM2B1231_4526 [Mycobacteroides abscessus subsp. bolletii 2B-1231]|nr:hypothetical protein MM2B0912R_4780 [Mycobacteroides abscessus subsp. bolletii 2B-0912-R]EIV18961.1 hypothetical protein MM2B0912S_4467 [Mycobacteroides abscessus subsp. bolletii 2B-0912-S]EIV72213.1 hypothetical protein MM2B1231_4526 [Mycobacteroides abscessus subsp. bolletii 2B-1231]EIV73596.1 hypothetical protein MM2B0107_3805 [Mycobacteroides abscessus subsp. bolletii 2B-0107]ETZ79307.1 hypothetical protein L831_4484 [Mycobacteroides abscessus MAB_082312_2272]
MMCGVQTVDKSQVVIPLGENGYHTQNLAVLDSDGGIRRDSRCGPTSNDTPNVVT